MLRLIQLIEHTPKEFVGRREEWDSLVRRDSSSSIFDTWEWLYSFWKTRDKPMETCFILELLDESELICGAAFRIRTTSSGSASTGKNLLEFLAQGSLTDYNTIPVLPNSSLPEISRCLCDHLLRRSPAIDVVNLKETRNGGRTLSILNSMGFQSQLTPDSKNFYLSLSKSWNDQNTTFKRSIRHNLARCQRNLVRDYPSAEFITDRNPTERTLESFFELHRLRMKTLSKDSQLLAPENVRFHKEFVLSASRKDWVRLFCLKVGGELVGAVYGFSFNQRFCYYGDGFLSDFANYSPVSLLIGKAIQSSIEEGHKELDFLRGEPSYKLHWTEESRNNYHLRMSSRSQNSVLKHTIARSFGLVKRHL